MDSTTLMQLSDKKYFAGTKAPLDTRTALLDAAAVLFPKLGFDGATAELLAEEAGVNKAMINYHFGGKAGLYRALLVCVLDEVHDTLGRLKEADLSAETKLSSFIEQFSALNARRPTLAALILREILSGGRFVDEDLMPRFLGIFENIRAIIWQGAREGAFRRVDPLLTHLSIVGALVFFFGTAPFRERLIAEGRIPALPPTTEKFVAHLQELVMHGIAPRLAAPAP